MYQQLKRASMALTLSSVCFLAFAQKTIQGTVKDANGAPMIGVTVYTNLKVYHFLIKKCTTSNRLQRYA